MSMAKSKTLYVCQECGATAARWSGRCSECESWNTLVEEVIDEPGKHVRPAIQENATPIPITEGSQCATERLTTHIPEFDRVLGGGIVPGSLTLVGGDPGIGKSTLMLQVGHHLATASGRVLYISGEESFDQTRLRAQRLGALSRDLLLLTETAVDVINDHLKKQEYSLVVVDSIQSVYSSRLPGVPGSVNQVRECAMEFLRIAKGQHPDYACWTCDKRRRDSGPAPAGASG